MRYQGRTGETALRIGPPVLNGCKRKSRSRSKPPNLVAQNGYAVLAVLDESQFNAESMPPFAKPRSARPHSGLLHFEAFVGDHQLFHRDVGAFRVEGAAGVLDDSRA